MLTRLVTVLMFYNIAKIFSYVRRLEKTDSILTWKFC